MISLLIFTIVTSKIDEMGDVWHGYLGYNAAHGRDATREQTVIC